MSVETTRVDPFGLAIAIGFIILCVALLIIGILCAKYYKIEFKVNVTDNEILNFIESLGYERDTKIYMSRARISVGEHSYKYVDCKACIIQVKNRKDSYNIVRKVNKDKRTYNGPTVIFTDNLMRSEIQRLEQIQQIMLGQELIMDKEE